MIVNYTYRMSGFDSEAEAKIRDFGDRLIRSRPYLIGLEIVESASWLYVTLRVTDIDRWRIKVHARKTIMTMALRARMKSADVELYGIDEVANRRGLQDGEGRTPRPRRPRSLEPQTSTIPESSAL